MAQLVSFSFLFTTASRLTIAYLYSKRFYFRQESTACGLLTDIDKLDAVSLDGLQRRGHVLQMVVLVRRSRIPSRQAAFRQHLDQGAKTRTVPEVLGEVQHGAAARVAGVLQVLVHPVTKGVGLNLHPEILVALDRHPLGGRTLGRSGHQAHQLLRPQLLGRLHPRGSCHVIDLMYLSDSLPDRNKIR